MQLISNNRKCLNIKYYSLGKNGTGGEEEIRHLSRGDYFGEQALIRNDQIRTANIVAESKEVECLVFDREWATI